MTRKRTETKSPRMTSPSDLATALAEDRVPWVCRSAGRLRLPLAIEHGREVAIGGNRTSRTKTGSPRNNRIVSRRHPASTNRGQESQSIATSHRLSRLPHRQAGSGWSVQGQQSCLGSIRSCLPARDSHAMPEANRCQAVACHDGLHLGVIFAWAARPFVPLKMVFRFIILQ